MDSSIADIFIVDDHPNNLQVLSILLTTEGYRVRKATSGSLALKSIQIEPPDLILLDISMPDLDGYEVCRQLKQNPQTQDIPIIFLSAFSEIHEKVKAFQSGGLDYISKPFHPAEVLVRVQTHLHLRRLQQQLQQQNAQLEREVRDRRRAEAALAIANEELLQLASTDVLTQVANRRAFDERLRQEWQRLAREQQPLSLILIDIDFFKSYNDTYGHPAGDTCLCQVASMLQVAAKRPADLVARYGGEEFVILLPNTEELGATQVALEIQTGVRSLNLPHSGSLCSHQVTLSMGMACTVPQLDIHFSDLIARADRALYQAKHAGRDRIIGEQRSLSIPHPDP